MQYSSRLNLFWQSGSDSRWFLSKKIEKNLVELHTAPLPSWKIPLKISILFFGYLPY